MLIDRPAIARLIPHAGAMLLLDTVLSWDQTQMRCATATHRDTANPLRRDNRLGILAGIEYVAQATALHAALTATPPDHHPVRAPVGYLASLRGLHCHIDRLDLLDGTLIVTAERLHADARGAIYDFTLCHRDRTLLTGRATVVYPDK